MGALLATPAEPTSFIDFLNISKKVFFSIIFFPTPKENYMQHAMINIKFTIVKH